MGSRDVAEQFEIGEWRFTPEVADVFDAHVRASVPFYDAIQDLIAVLSDWTVPDQGIVADLGAATGTTVERIFSRHPSRSIQAWLYDEQPEMLGKAATRLQTHIAAGQVQLKCRKIEDGVLEHQNANLTLAIFTLQFLPPHLRTSVLAQAFRASRPSGALIVAEKIRPPDSRWSEIANDVSHDYKEERGISAEAIRAKSKALRGVIIPTPAQDLISMITTAGWKQPETLFRWHQWIVIGAFAS